MQASELLKIIVAVVSAVAAVLGGLIIAAFVRFRREVLRIEKRRALHKFYPQADDESDSGSHTTKTTKSDKDLVEV